LIGNLFNGVLLALYRWNMIDVDAILLGVAHFLLFVSRFRVFRYRLVLALILNLLSAVDPMDIALSTLVLRIYVVCLDLLYANWPPCLKHYR
jgi:hypothetical protein